MRGDLNPQDGMLSSLSPAARVPATHPLRQITTLADAALQEWSATLDALYRTEGRPSIPRSVC